MAGDHDALIPVIDCAEAMVEVGTLGGVVSGVVAVAVAFAVAVEGDEVGAEERA